MKWNLLDFVQYHEIICIFQDYSKLKYNDSVKVLITDRCISRNTECNLKLSVIKSFKSKNHFKSINEVFLFFLQGFTKQPLYF